MRYLRRVSSLAVFCACALMVGRLGAQEAPAAPAKTYTLVNLWVEPPKPIQSTNYHVGELIPLGSEVTVEPASGKTLAFTYQGRRLSIELMSRHTKVSLDALKTRTFGPVNPLATEAFKSLTEELQTAVKAGRLLVGMPKAAVLMAYGYPPEHRTPSTEENAWSYWKNKLLSGRVLFVDGKVSEIVGPVQ